MGCIYKIINKINKQLYIGQTREKDPFKRWKGHLYEIRQNRGCPILGNAIRKYGEDAFEFKIILLCFDEDCNELEKQYIAKLNTLVPNGYNVHIGGTPGGCFKGLKHTPETRAVIGEKSREYNSSPAAKQIQSERVKNFFKDPQKREAHSIAMKKVYDNLKVINKTNILSKSDQTKQKISESLTKYWTESNEYSDTRRGNHSKAMIKAIGRKIYQFDMHDKFIASFDCIQNATDNTGIGRRAINACVVGRTKTSGGFKWKYAD